MTAGDGSLMSCRILITTTGNLSEPRGAAIRSLANFKGEVYRTSRWPKHHIQPVGLVRFGSSAA